MKIAILHDSFDVLGGAEISLLYLAKGLQATIFTTNIDFDAIKKLGFNEVKIKSIGKVPNIDNIKQPLTKIKFWTLKLKGFDLFIFGGCYSIFASARNQPNLWLCFSPLKGLYLPEKKVSEFIKSHIVKIQKAIDKGAVKKIGRIIASSKNVQKRIKDIYAIDSVVVYSPIETKIFYCNSPQDYWLSLARIDPYKRIEMQVEAFKSLKDKKLMIVGGASKFHQNYFEQIKKTALDNVEFAGPVFDKEKIKNLYANCRGFITTSKDEDFGMNVVEAMASGKPVIAPNEGGYKETIINGKTGTLIDNIDEDKLAQAIEEMDKKIQANPLSFKNACQEQAKRFDVEVFIGGVTREINDVLKNG